MEEKIKQILSELKSIPTTWGIRNKDIPVNYFKPTEENAKKFNELLEFCQFSLYTEIELTQKNQISSRGFILPCYSYTFCKIGCQLIIMNERAYKIQFRAEIAKSKANKDLTGTRAYFKFKKMCLDYGINLDSYAIPNGKEVNETIEKPMIKFGPEGVPDAVYTKVNHIDFHSSYPTGLVNKYPEFKEIIETLYNGREEMPEYKSILNFSIGMFHSRLIGYKLAHLAKAAIEDNNKRLLDLTEELHKNNRAVLLYNTDGIWYQGEVYHGEGEGTTLCTWTNDHVNCKFRMRSVGAYEYIENGEYHPVVRGITPLDKLLPRTEWKWGDILEGDIITFSFNELGILIVNGEEYGGEKRNC